MSEYLDEQVNPSESSLEFIDTAINLSAALHNDGVLSREMAAIDNAEVDDEASSPTLKLKRIRSDRQHSIERRITDWLDMQGIFQVDPSSKRDVYYENKRHALLAMKLPQQLKLQRLTAHTHGHGQSRQGSKDGHDDDSQRHINNAPSHFQISLNKLTRSHLFARRQHNASTVAATAATTGGGHNNLHGNKHHHHVHHAGNTHRQSNHGLLQRRFRQEQCEEEEVEVDMEDRDFIEDGFNKEEQGQIMKQHRIGTAGGLEEGRREEKQERLEQVGISDDGFLLSEKNSDEDCNQLRFQGQQQILNNLCASTTATTIAATNSSCEEDLAMEGMLLSSKGELQLSNSSIEAKKIPSKQKQQQQYRQIRSQADSQATIDTEMESEEQDQEQTDGVVLSSSPKEKVQEEQLA